MRSRTLIQAYHRARFLGKVMLAVFALTALGLLLWVFPWLPWGLTTDDYDAGVLVGVGLAAGAWVSAFGAVYLRDQSNRYEQTLVTWTSVHDQLGDLRSREYFFERVIIECNSSERTGIPFCVFAARFDPGDGMQGDDIATMLESLSGLVRQTDSLAALGPQEIGVLGAAMSTREGPAFASRLKSMLERAVSGGHGQVNVGWTTWGVDGRDAGSLVGLARTRVQRQPFGQETLVVDDGTRTDANGAGTPPAGASLTGETSAHEHDQSRKPAA